MRETAHILGSDQSLFGIVTHPPDRSVSQTGVIILNAGHVHHVGPNRIHVEIARQLARAGFATARIDQSGKGESPVRSGLSRTECLLRDFDDVSDHMSGLGVSRYVIFGLCSGADDALIIANQRRQVVGLAMLDGFVDHTPLRYVDYVLRRAADPHWLKHPPRNVIKRAKGRLLHPGGQAVDVRDWDEPEIMNAYYRDFLDRDGKIIAIFTLGARYYSRRGQLAASLGTDKGLTEVYLNHASHTYCERESRDSLYQNVLQWLSRTFAEDARKAELTATVEA